MTNVCAPDLFDLTPYPELVPKITPLRTLAEARTAKPAAEVVRSPHPIAEFIAARIADLDGPLAALCRELLAEHNGMAWRPGDLCPGCSCGEWGCPEVEYPCRTIRLTAGLWAEHSDYRTEWAA